MYIYSITVLKSGDIPPCKHKNLLLINATNGIFSNDAIIVS